MYDSSLLRSVQKPGRYSGGEYGQIIKDKEQVKARFAFCFPDSYEIGMSNLGMRILYGVLNQSEDVWCERVFAPWQDMTAKLREKNILLTAHESGDNVRDFDFLGFTLQYEMCYTNILNVLDLSGIPLKAEDRGEEFPIVIGGGPCAYNPEPLAEFFDLFYLGEGETRYEELIRLYQSLLSIPSGIGRLSKFAKDYEDEVGKSYAESAFAHIVLSELCKCLCRYACFKTHLGSAHPFINQHFPKFVVTYYHNAPSSFFNIQVYYSIY